MTMMFVLVLLGSSLWGATNVLKKPLLKNMDVSFMIVATMLGAAVAALPAQFIIFGKPSFPMGLWLPLVGNIISNIAIQYFGLRALKLEDASIVAALQGWSTPLIVVTSWFILKEFPTIPGLIGILITTIGTHILNLQGTKTNRERFITPWLRLASSKGARFALFAAVSIAIAINFDKMVVVQSGPIMRTSMVFFAVATFTYLAASATGKWQKIDKTKFWPLFGIGLLMGIANVIMDGGLLFGIVPYVGSLKRFQIVTTAVLAALFLKEKYAKPRVVASIIIVIGMIFLAF